MAEQVLKIYHVLCCIPLNVLVCSFVSFIYLSLLSRWHGKAISFSFTLHSCMFNSSNRDNDRDPSSSQQGPAAASSPVMSSTPDRAVHFKPPTPPPHDNQVSQSRENLVDQSLYNRSPGPQQASSPYPPHQQQPYNNYYNGYYPQQQPGYYYPPPHQAVPVNVQVATTRQWPAVFTYLTALGMLAVLIYELVYNKQVTGNVIETSPFNIMIGPSANVSRSRVNGIRRVGRETTCGLMSCTKTAAVAEWKKIRH